MMLERGTVIDGKYEVMAVKRRRRGDRMCKVYHIQGADSAVTWAVGYRELRQLFQGGIGNRTSQWNRARKGAM